MEADPLDVPASPERIRDLHARGFFPEPVARRALELATGSPPLGEWVRFLRRGLLVLGTLLVLAGVIFFFAYNWEALGRLEKLALVLAGIVACAIGAWQLGDRLAGSAALFGAVALTGGWLAVYGQAYQTGADPYSLFAAWAGLTLPWVVAGRAAAFWALWLVVLNTALVLYFAQVVGFDTDPFAVAVWVAVLNGCAWAAWENAEHHRLVPAARWLPRLLAAVTFAALTVPAAVEVALLGGDQSAQLGPSTRWALAAVVLAIPLAVWRFGFTRRQELFVVALASLAAMALLDVLVARGLLETLELDALPFLVLGLLVVAQMGALAAGLAWLARRLPPGSAGGAEGEG